MNNVNSHFLRYICFFIFSCNVQFISKVNQGQANVKQSKGVLPLEQCLSLNF